jgi:excisionase family DNA binding protein
MWITTAQAAKETGYTVSYIRRLARQGRIKAQRTGSERRGEWYIDLASLRAFKAEMDAAGTSKHGRRDE